MKLWCAALTLILLSLVAALFFYPYSPAPPHKNLPVERTRAVQAEVSRGNIQLFQATAYTHTGNPTATGTMPKRGTIAADPSVLPYGTRIFIPGYGYGVVADCGGLIQGNRLDLFMESREEAVNW